MIDYTIRRSTRRATVSIAIDPESRVVVITQRLKRESDRPPAPGAKEFVSGETFRYLGRQYRLRVERTNAARPVGLKRGWLCVAVPARVNASLQREYVRGALIEWCRGKARERLPARVEFWAKKLGMKAPAVIIR